MAATRRTSRVIALLMTMAVIASLSVAGSAAADEPRRVLYLTFDDGPALDSATGSLLDLLASEGIAATFFVVGDNVDRHPEMIGRIVGAGHALGNHTDTHRPLDAMSPEQVRTEFRDNQAAVTRAGGPTMTCYRPPFGATNASVRSIGASLGMSEQMWDLDIHDYERIGAQLYADALDRANDGDVILLHDGYVDGEMTVEALRRFLADERDEVEFRVLPGCTGDGPAPTTSTTQPTTSTTQPTTTTTQPTTTTTTTAPPTTAPPLVVSGDIVVPSPACRLGPLGSIVDATNPTQGAVFRIYCSHLGRQVDRAGFDYWLGIALEAKSLRPLSYAFLQSEEFVSTYGELDDQQFIDTVYSNVLGRSPDTAGRTYWVGLLVSGVERSSVMLGFSESMEFRQSTGTA